jgi:lactoylglutathione lyase
MEGIKSIGHIALRVTDIDRSLAFYVGGMGFEEMFRLDRDGELWIVYLRVTDEQFIELFPGGKGDRAPDAETIGYNHLCLEVDDLDAVIARLAERGVSLSRPKKVAADGNAQAWVKDPDGHRIELMQLLPGCLHIQAIERLRERRLAGA